MVYDRKGLNRDVIKCMGRLLLFAILSQIPYCMAFAKQGLISFIGYNPYSTIWTL